MSVTWHRAGAREIVQLRPLLVGACVAVQACAAAGPGSPAPQTGVAESGILGRFQDDYGIEYTITAAEWTQHPRARYHIVRWNPAGQYLIAHNDAANPSDGGRWTRIDWLPLSGMAPYEWGFCLSAYNAPSLEAAEAIQTARRETPRTGCSGFPFSRMQRRP